MPTLLEARPTGMRGMPSEGPPAPPREEAAAPDAPAGRTVARIALAAALVTGVMLPLRELVPPDAVPASAPATQFSAARAMRHVAAVAREPRPVTSRGHEVARAYIVEQVRRLGLEPELQVTTSALRFPGAEGFNAGSVANVLVRVTGRASTGAIVLDAHYDGGATGPAAGDCGACVATLLETMRALRAGPPLRNDVVFVFADAEEVGDLGAHAFVTQHPWMRDVRLALGFEAMGTRGPASMYLASPGDRRLVAELAAAVPGAKASSFMPGLLATGVVARPACDLTDYVDAGRAGLAFIFAGNTAAYHTALDDAVTLDPRSVQHFGTYALSLVRHFGDRDIGRLAANAADGDAVYFNAWPGRVVHYGAGLAPPLALVAAALLVLVLARRMRRGELRPARVLRAALAFFGSVALTTACVAAAWWAIRATDPGLQVVLLGGYGLPWHLAALWAFALACMTAAATWLAPRMTPAHRLAGALLGFAALALLTAAAFPGGSYLFAWPVLAGIPALAWRDDGHRGRTLATAVTGVVVTLVVLLPAGLDLFVGLLSRVQGLTGLPLLGVAPVFVTLAAGLVLPLLAVPALAPDTSDVPARTGRRWLPPLAIAAGGVLLVLLANRRSRFDTWQPRPSEVQYELDADAGSARWTTHVPRLDEWTSLFIAPGTPRNVGHFAGLAGPPTFVAAAPLLVLPAPELEVESSDMASGVHTLRLRALPVRERAMLLELRVAAAGALLDARVAGLPLDLRDDAPARRGTLAIEYAAPPDTGVTLVLRVRGGGRVRVTLASRADGLPALPELRMPRRPRTTMPTAGGTTDGTIVRRTFTIDGSRSSAPSIPCPVQARRATC